MRTGQSLFNELAEDDKPKEAPIRKGRSSILIGKRNELLIHRYAFYVIYTELRPEAVNQRLVEEFHLQEGYLLNIVYARANDIKAMRKSPPSIKKLKALHPHFNWSIPTQST